MSRAQRKIDHINHAIQTGQSRAHGFDDVQFVHQSISNLSVHSIQYRCQLGELSLSSPIIINAMTGGGGEHTLKINESLSHVANECNLALAVGSQMAALKDSSERETYKVVRKNNPNGIIFANLGSEASVEQVKMAIDMIEANAIQIHLNTVQELVMPEGDRDFSNTLSRLEKIIQAASVPVIVKEVGFGMSKETAEHLLNIGAKYIDVGGFGGTNFSRIENERRARRLSYFNDWGISSAASIVETRYVSKDMAIVGSGGIQNALDVIKALRLGADAVGIAGFLLRSVVENGLSATISEVVNIHEDLEMLMTALGVSDLQTLKTAPIVIKGETFHWLSQRGIDTSIYSQ